MTTLFYKRHLSRAVLSARLRQVGVASLLFFTAKGLLWLSLPLLLADWL